MNALKCPGNIWTKVTRVTPPSVYWSCATAEATDIKERQVPQLRIECFVS